MSNFSLGADFYAVIWPRIVLGIGTGFFFIPLTTMTMSGIKKEDMGNASAIYNLLGNFGGSFGVATSHGELLKPWIVRSSRTMTISYVTLN